MKDLEKLKEKSLQELSKILVESEAEILKPDIGWSKTNDLENDIKKIRRLITQRNQLLD